MFKRKLFRKRILSGLLAVGMTFSSASAYSSTVMAEDKPSVSENIQAEFFVSTTGNDENPGTYEQPFATVDAARKAVAKINKDMTGDIYVFVMPGTYYVPEGVDFGVEDSGSNGYDVIYKCLGEEGSAKLVGGIRVDSAWEKVGATTDVKNADSDMASEMEGKIYKTNLKAQLDETFGEDNWPATSGPLQFDKDGKFTVNTMTVNDTRATQARTLNSKKFAGMPATLFENPLYTAGGNNVYMNYKAQDADKLSLDKLQNAEDRGDLSAQIVCNDIGGRRAWDSDTLPITDVDAGAGKLVFNPNDVGEFAPLYTIGGDSRYYLQGNLAFLDTPGEFYFNPKTYDLYYYPMDGQEDLSAQNIVVPTTQKVVNLTGERTGVWDDTKITPVKDITFDGLQFSDTCFPDYYSSGWPWLPYASGSLSKYGFPEWAQKSSNPIYCGGNERPQFQVGTVHLQYTDGITIENCNVKNATVNGIEMYLGVTNTLVENCLVEYCANGGIQIEGGYPGIDGNSDSVSFTNNNTVRNTVVHDVGQLVHQTFGIQVSHATYNTIENCEIYNSPRRALLLTGSDIGSWNNTASGNRNWNPDNAYDVSRDEYAHGNKFSNIYLHDAQQDGGDDGALFTVFVYYSNHKDSARPNKYDQIVIDETGANPTMGDISPNNINLDMGWCGVEMSNIKTVNPQHYTIENSHLRDGEVKVDNCSFYFKNPQDGLEKFDDSKMDYANIGIQTWKYPENYRHAIKNTTTERPENAYFEEEFEKGLDFKKWSYSGAKPEITKIYMSEGAFNGKAALVANNTGAEKPVLYKEFDENLNKVVTAKFFDRQLSPSTTYGGEGHRFPDTGKTTVRVDDGTDANIVSLGIDPSADNNYYVMNIGGTKTATSVRRVYGWHEAKFDYSEAGKVTLYVDGVEAGTADRDSFNYVALGSPSDTGEAYYDQLYIYGGEDTAKAAVKAASADVKAEEQSEDLINWDFEDNVLPFDQVLSGSGNYSGAFSGNTMVGFWNTAFSVVDNPLNNDGNVSSKVLGRSGQGGCQAYAQQDPQWKNYIWEFDYLYKSSAAGATDNSISFIIYSQNANDGLASGPVYQPNGYWFSINEAGKALELRKGANNKGLTQLEILDSVKIDPAEFNKTWHNVKIYAKNASDYTDITVYVDGEKTLTGRDTANPYKGGTIAFNSMGTDFYMDNFKVSQIPDGPLAGYDKNFKFGNAVLDKEFDVNTYSYHAVITEPTEDVTLIKPEFDGVEYTVELNGEDITDSFSDAVTPVVLALKPGNNKLLVTEKTAQNVETVYTFELYKESSLKSTDIPKTMDITVGEMPNLPATAKVVVTDGEKDYEFTTAVEWDMVDQSSYKQPGKFTVEGHLTEVSGETVKVEVNVEGLKSVASLEMVSGTAKVDPAPVLAKTLGLTYEYSGTKDMPIVFKSFDAAVYENEGTIVAVGSVEGYDKDVVQLVKLEADTEEPGTPEEPSKEELEKKIAEAEERLKDDNYSKALKDKLQTAVDDAKAALESGKEEDMKDAIAKLDEVLGEIDEEIAVRAAFQKFYNECEAYYKEENHSAENWDAYQKALDAAKEVLDNPESSTAEMRKALGDLVEITEKLNAELEEKPGKPEQPEKPEKPGNGPITGDNMNVMSVVIMLVVAAVAVGTVLVIKKRKKEQ